MSREHLDDGHQDLAGQLPVRKGAARESFDLVDPPRPLRAESHHLLCEHVQRTRRNLHALDLAFEHPLGDDGALEQIPLELGKEDSLAPLAYRVPRSADSLEAARDRSRRFHQNHQIDRPHIDPELEGARGDDALELAPLQRFFDLAALRVGKASMVSAEERSLGELVQPLGGFLGERAAVDEDECRPMRPEKIEDLGVDPGPKRTGLVRLLRRGHTNRKVDVRGLAGIDDLDGAVAGEKPRDLVRRAERWPKDRCAGDRAPSTPRVFRAKGPGGHRASFRRGRGSRRRSRCARS